MSVRYESPSRRSFLRLLSTAGTASIFGRLLWPHVAEAQTAPPLRFVQIASVHGKDDMYWNPQGTDTSFNINFANATLAPLQPYRSRVLTFQGLDYQVLIDTMRTGHNGGPATCFTGTSIATDSYYSTTSGPSLDVALSEQLGGTTPIRSIQISNHADYCTDDSMLSFSDSGQKLPNLVSPRDVFDRLFGTFMPPAMSGVDPVARRTSLVNYWLKDANALRAKLGAPEQYKLDAHLAALNDIERRITATTVQTAACVPPPQPRVYSDAEISGCSGSAGELLIPERTMLLADILAEAFACDITRFAALRISPGLTAQFGMYLTDPTTQTVHIDLAHQMDGSPPAAATLNQVQLWVSTMVAYLLGKLDAINEGSGTVLDHSLLIWGNELSDPAEHSNTDMPYVVMGGCNGKLKMGRAMVYPSGTPHNKLLCSVANAFDQNLDHFGDPAYPGQLSLSWT